MPDVRPVESNPAASDVGDIPPLQWTAHPARQRPLAACGAVAVIIAFSMAVYGVGRESLWSIGAAIVMCLALSRFFFPTRYLIDGDGVTAWTALTTRRIAWRDVRRIDVGGHAAWISPSRRRNWREARRGVHVLYGNAKADVRARLLAAQQALNLGDPSQQADGAGRA